MQVPFKCFNCGEVGNFAVKCPYNKNRDSSDEEDYSFKERRRGKSRRKKYFQKQKKSLYSKEENSSYDETDSDEMLKVLFMRLETQNVETKNFENA